jgi:hypothetical protein
VTDLEGSVDGTIVILFRHLSRGTAEKSEQFFSTADILDDILTQHLPNKDVSVTLTPISTVVTSPVSYLGGYYFKYRHKRFFILIAVFVVYLIPALSLIIVSSFVRNFVYHTNF